MYKTAAILLLSICIFPIAAATPAAPEITAQPGQVNPYKTRSELLMDASAYTGVTAPEQAAAVWATGLKLRSAAMQYTVMTDGLKREYAGRLDALRSNWVTGMSSPWIQSFTITEINKNDDTHTDISLSLEAMASYGPSEFYHAELSLVHEDGFWRVERIWTDEGLYPYTLYKP